MVVMYSSYSGRERGVCGTNQASKELPPSESDGWFCFALLEIRSESDASPLLTTPLLSSSEWRT